jgi:hypothetical protein
MSNILEVPQQQAIQALIAKGWSIRSIASTLCINRRTVKRYAAAVPKCTTEVIAGSVPSVESKCTTQVITGSRSLCGGFQEVIAPMLELGLSAQRIYQDLVTWRARLARHHRRSDTAAPWVALLGAIASRRGEPFFGCGVHDYKNSILHRPNANSGWEELGQIVPTTNQRRVIRLSALGPRDAGLSIIGQESMVRPEAPLPHG